MKTTVMKVTCAVIERNGTFLVCQRTAEMSRPLQWEFPGGKVDGDESEEECIVRELEEELRLKVKPAGRLPEHVYDYGDKTICLIPFVCDLEEGTPVLLEHEDARWATPEQIVELDLCDADRPVAEFLLGARHIGSL